MPDQEDSTPVAGDLVQGDKPVLSGTFTGTVNVGSTIIQQVAPVGAPAAPRPRIFLSYAHRDDKAFVLRLHRDLLARGFDVWRDETDLGSDGPDLTDAVRDEIERCPRFVPVIGPAAFERPVVQAEWAHARLCCKPFTPVWRLGERPQPDGFEAALYVDFRDDAHYAARLDELARLLGRTPDSPGPLLTRVPELPPGVIPRRELEQLRRLRRPLAGGTATVAITGRAATHAVQAAGGLGKSVLAAIFARECPTRWAFGDGVVWLEVGKTPAIATLQAQLGRLFGDDPREYVDAKVGASRLQRLLAAKHVLIVLDDVWDYHHVEAFIVDAPRCRWLVTTRLGGLADDLGLAEEQRVALDTLADDEALELIARRLNDRPRAARDRALHLEIVHELGGHTQAVAIAAARLAARGKKGLAAAELLRRYRDPRPGENPLSVLRLEDERKELNLEKSLGESYTLLDKAGRRRFRQLGVFAPEGTFGVAAAAAVWQVGASAADEALRELVDLGLLSAAGEGRNSQHALLRAYALALLRAEAGQEAAARGRHFGYYARAYENRELNRGYQEPDRHDRITADFDNIRHALAWAFEAAPGSAYQLVNALDQGYTQFRHSTQARQTLLLQAQRAARAAGDSLGEANTIRALGDVHRMLAEYDQARAQYEAARAIYQAIGDRLGEANTIKALGHVHLQLGETGAARARYEEARAIYARIGVSLGEANTIKALGHVHLQLGETGAARARYEEARPIYARIGDSLGEANTIQALGDVHLSLADYGAARAQYEAARAIYQAIGDRLGEANTIRALGDVHLSLAEYDQARAQYEAARAIYQAIGDRLGEANTIRALGDVHLSLADYGAARAKYEAARPIYQASGASLGEANTIKALGHVHLQLGETGAARARYEEARAIYARIGDSLGEANTIQALGDVHLQLGETGAARARYEEARAIYARIGASLGEANTIQALGELAGELEQEEMALQLLAEAAAVYRSLELPRDEASCYNSMAVVMSGLKRHEEALGYCERALSIYPDAMIYRNQADSLIELERYDEAARTLDKAESLQPGQPYALLHRGRIALWTGQPADAVPWLERAVTMRPLLNNFHYWLAYALLAARAVDRALTEFDRALELTHKRKDLQDTVEELARLGRVYGPLPGLDLLGERLRRALDDALDEGVAG